MALQLPTGFFSILLILVSLWVLSDLYNGRQSFSWSIFLRISLLLAIGIMVLLDTIPNVLAIT